MRIAVTAAGNLLSPWWLRPPRATQVAGRIWLPTQGPTCRPPLDPPEAHCFSAHFWHSLRIRPWLQRYWVMREGNSFLGLWLGARLPGSSQPALPGIWPSWCLFAVALIPSHPCSRSSGMEAASLAWMLPGGHRFWLLPFLAEAVCRAHY